MNNSSVKAAIFDVIPFLKILFSKRVEKKYMNTSKILSVNSLDSRHCSPSSTSTATDNATLTEWMTSIEALRLQQNKIQDFKLLADVKVDLEEILTFVTPKVSLLMVAARYGKVRLAHYLTQLGENLMHTDEQGMSVQHYAAQCASSLFLQYLCLCHAMNLSVKDADSKTLLHIACESKSESVVKYLLKNEVCSLSAQDSWGNTPLHLAARENLGHVCFLLVQQGGVKLLTIENHSGQTAQDLATGELGAALIRWVNAGHAESQVLWMCHLLLPSMLLTLSVLISHTPMAYSWLSAVCGSILYISSVVFSSHRLSDKSRWLNPSKLGGFVGIFTHCSISAVYMAGKMSYSLFSVASVVMAIPVSYLFYLCLIRDPGFFYKSKLMDDGTPYTMQYLMDELESPSAFCESCQLIPSRPVKHCKMCNRCVFYFDHHCLFTLKCIGRANLQIFLWFNILLVLTQVSYIWLSLEQLGFSTSISYYGFLSSSLISESWITCVCCLTIYWLAMASYQLLIELWSVARGYTMLYLLKGVPPTQMSLCQNLVNLIYFLTVGSYKYKHPVIKPSGRQTNV